MYFRQSRFYTTCGEIRSRNFHWIFLTVFLTLVPLVHLIGLPKTGSTQVGNMTQPEVGNVSVPTMDDVVKQCEKESKKLSKNEDKFAMKRPRQKGEPNLAGGGACKFCQDEVTAREKRQRPFECITDKTNPATLVLATATPEYLKLATKCKSKQPQPSCDASYKFRTFDGTCNNKLNTKWGSLFRCLRRFLPANYEGASGFRQSVCGKPLPDPRNLSLHIHPEKCRLSQNASNMLMYFGQFIAHDTTDVSVSSIGRQTIDCCSNPQGPQHPQCAPIILQPDDPFYSKFNVTCFNFVRTAPCATCNPGKRNNMNQETSYVDLSVIYGLNKKEAEKLRYKTKLKTQHTDCGELMPPDPETDFCSSREPSEYCFASSDRRVNQHTSLMTLHTLFVREHNRLAEELKKINPDCSDDDIYQYARVINIAQFQVIIYKEFLPFIVGPDLMAIFQMNVQEEGCSVYDPLMDATTWVEFNTAAYRLHTMISNTAFTGDGKKHCFKDTYGDPDPLYANEMDSWMKGVCQSPAQKFDRYIDHAMSEFMYKKGDGDYGFDIATINIQRGRDNGLPTYTDIVALFTLGKTTIQTFDDLKVYMCDETIKILKNMYCDVRDIDLWVGLISERVPDNKVVGPTAAKIIATQFWAWKLGDRFYFENCGNEHFKEKHRQTLKTVTLSSLLCLNTNISSIQENAMLLPSDKNPIKSCKDIPKMDISRFNFDC